MSTVTPAPIYPVSGDFATTPPYSGTFIPTLWSGMFNVAFYAASTFNAVTNNKWQGEISSMGDKVIIQNPPTMYIRDYVVGTPLTYDVPVSDTLELVVDKGFTNSFQINDVLEHQSKPNLMKTFSDEAAQQMRIAVDSWGWYKSFNQAHPGNVGVNAGVKSGGYNMGSDAAPVALDANNVLRKILEMAAVLDEQHVPDSGRWLAIDPYTRTLLMQSNLAQAQYTGDATSIVRNGKIGTIDRFDLYLTTQLPRVVADDDPWISGNGEMDSVTGNGPKRRCLLAGHDSAITFASHVTKTEQVRNPFDFGDFVRSLQVAGTKVVKPEALVTAIVA